MKRFGVGVAVSVCLLWAQVNQPESQTVYQLSTRLTEEEAKAKALREHI
jgi:hypothetical protein